jgi:DNA phosphorothioation-dependent restriction protein DptF
MPIHPLVNELQKLRESSKHAVAQATSYSLDEFSEYLHIEREVERNLRDHIKHCASKDEAQLLLVCGNVGDGKSHILSYLNKELKEELNKFTIHNDATESHNPNESSNDTLHKLLEGFRDVNIDSSTDKIVLAINLGTLSKFLEEHEGDYGKLNEYVSSKKILDTDVVDDDQFDENSSFQHVNFTDYHMYSLTAEGPTSLIMSTLLKKLVSDDKRNPVYKAYLELKDKYPFSKKCPIRYNYEFLINEDNREAIMNLIIQAIVKNKEIISVRSLLNFFYDLSVPVGLNWESIEKYEMQLSVMKEAEYLSLLIPNYLFEHQELSGLFDKLAKLDPCVHRYSGLDYSLIQLINSEEPKDVFSKFIRTDILQGIDKKISRKHLKADDLTKLFIRLNFFGKRKEVLHLSDPYFEKYMSSLHHFNNNNPAAIEETYQTVKEAARRWYGDPKNKKKVVVNIGRNQSQYRVFKDFKAEPGFLKSSIKDNAVLTKFVQEFILYFKLDNEKDPIEIHIDYALYEILNRIMKGYRPNKKDNNNYISFVNLINKLINQDNETASLEIDEINIGKLADYELHKDETFGKYKFQAL